MSNSTLYLLVDYDNIDKATVGSTLSDVVNHLIERAIKNMSIEDKTSCKWVIIRLYGGWYDNLTLTNRAQELIAVIKPSPLLFKFEIESKKYSWRVTIQLALALLSIPSIHLIHTYRVRQKLTGIKVKDPISVGCDPNKCRIQGIEGLIKHNRCPDCGTPGNKILWRTEQKLVDIMLATDLIHLSSTPDDTICIVTSDDDFWPVMLYVTDRNRRVYHMHCKPRKSNKDLYGNHFRNAYVELTL